MPVKSNIQHAKLYECTIVNGQKLHSANLGNHATNFQLDPNMPTVLISEITSAKNLRLPEATSDIEGLTFIIRNASGGANALTVQTSAGSTVQALAQHEGALFHCDGATWRALIRTAI